MLVVALDTSVLGLLLHPEAHVPNDPTTLAPLRHARDRLQYLVEQLREAEARLVIPTPVLGEFLTVASAEYLDIINGSSHFDVVGYGQREAIEAALTLRADIESGRGKRVGLEDDWQKIKVDRQIVAIAKVAAATTVYTTDRGLATLVTLSGLKAVHVADLPMRPSSTPLLDAADLEEHTPVRSDRLEGRTPNAPLQGLSPRDGLTGFE